MTNREAIERIERHMIIHHAEEERAVYITEALKMAIEALKEQEPHVLTLDELRKVEPGTVLWQDIRNNPEIKDEWMPMFPVEFIRFSDFAGDETIEFSLGMDYCAEYGKSFLLWTAKPSDEQREKVKWE